MSQKHEKKCLKNICMTEKYRQDLENVKVLIPAWSKKVKGAPAWQRWRKAACLLERNVME